MSGSTLSRFDSLTSGAPTEEEAPVAGAALNRFDQIVTQRNVPQFGQYVNKNIFNEETIYSPEGVPLVTYGGGEPGAVTRNIAQAATGLVGMAPKAAIGLSGGLRGAYQLAGKALGFQGDQPEQIAQEMSRGISEAAGPYSYVTARPAELAGSVADPLAIKAFQAAKAGTKMLPNLPQYAKRMAEYGTAGAATSVLAPTETGLKGEEFFKKKAENIAEGTALSAGLGLAAPVAKWGADKLGSAIAETLGFTSGVGSEAVKTAYRSGIDKLPEFWNNLTGKTEKTKVLDDAIAGLQKMQKKISNDYRSGMIDIKGDKSILGFDNIDNAVKKSQEYGLFHGEVKNEAAIDAMQKVSDKINTWKSKDPSVFHTPEGLDALKQSIGGILEKIPPDEKTARKAVQEVYKSVKQEISDQAPTYAAVMKNYEEGMDLIGELKKTLSLNDKASADTTLRKLQSLMRNNVNTNYGYRLDLAQQLEKEGGVQLMPALAGQAMSSVTPRSLAAQGLLGIGGLAGAYTQNPLAVVGLPFQSPAAVGAAAYGAGRLASMLKPSTPNAPNAVKDLLLLRGAQEATNQ